VSCRKGRERFAFAEGHLGGRKERLDLAGWPGEAEHSAGAGSQSCDGTILIAEMRSNAEAIADNDASSVA